MSNDRGEKPAFDEPKTRDRSPAEPSGSEGTAERPSTGDGKFSQTGPPSPARFGQPNIDVDIDVDVDVDVDVNVDVADFSGQHGLWDTERVEAAPLAAGVAADAATDEPLELDEDDLAELDEDDDLAELDEDDDLAELDEDDDLAEGMDTPNVGLTTSPTLDDTVPSDDLASDDQENLDSDTDPHLATAPDPGVVALRAPLVGRQDQLNRLKEVFLDSWNNRTVNLVTLMGPSGYGKTRVAREFARSVNAAIPDARVLWGTAVDRTASPYEAIAGALAARFGIGHAEQPEDVRNKIANAVAESLPDPLHEEVSHLIAHLMGVPFPESPVIDSLARELQDLDLRCHIAVRRFFEHQAEKGPLLLCFDGMENARAETVNLLHYLASNMPNHPVLIVAAARPNITELHPGWGRGDIKHHQIDITPLSPHDMLKLFRALLSVDTVPDEVARRVREGLEGNPRAVFSFARYLLETRAVRGDEGHWQFWRPSLAQVDLPASPNEILRARLQALPGAESALLKQAAAIGPVFWVDTLVALGREDKIGPEQPDGPLLEHIAAWGEQTNGEVLSLLSNLCERGLVAHGTSTTIAGEREYRFAYQPVCDLAYELYASEGTKGGLDSQPDLAARASARAQQQRFHKGVAQWIQLRPDADDELRQLQIAAQLELASDQLGAGRYYRRAAALAWRRHDGGKAIALYRHALCCVGGADLGLRLKLWHAFGQICVQRGDLDDAIDAFERTLRLAWAVASRPRAAIAFNMMGRVWRTKGNLDLALEYLTRGLDMSREARDAAAEGSCLDDIAQVHWTLGRYDLALDYVAKALEIRRRIGHKGDLARTLSTIGRIERERGFHNAAESCFREALALQRETRDRHGYLVSLADTGTLHLLRSQLDKARDSWERTLREAKRLGAQPLAAQLHAFMCELGVRSRELDQARVHGQNAIDLAAETQDQPVYLQAIRTLGVVELLSGNADKGRRYIEESITLASNPELLPGDETELLPCIARAQLALAEVHAATLFDASVTDGPPPAEAHFLKAIDLLRQMGAEAELARALQRLGGYQMERGEWEAAQAALREALELAQRHDLAEAETIEAALGGADE